MFLAPAVRGTVGPIQQDKMKKFTKILIDKLYKSELSYIL
jgi:hypothetical protein